jgi:hypothetical protein
MASGTTGSGGMGGIDSEAKDAESQHAVAKGTIKRHGKASSNQDTNSSLVLSSAEIASTRLRWAVHSMCRPFRFGEVQLDDFVENEAPLMRGSFIVAVNARLCSKKGFHGAVFAKSANQ